MKRNISEATLVSTYRISSQKRIADGRYTAAILFICSLIFWGAGALFGAGSVVEYVPTWALQWLSDGNAFLLRCVALLFSLSAAFLMASYVILEHRVAWQSCMFLFVASVAFNVRPDASAFFAMLFPVVIAGLLFRCDTSSDIVRKLYTLFAVTTASALLFPQLIILLPLLLLYPALGGKLSARSFFAALLGVATPLWVVASLIYLFPSLAPLLVSPKETLVVLWQMPRVTLSPAMLLMMIAELVVALPAMIHFFVTATIGRTHLRRRMVFCIALDIVLWFAGWLQPELFTLFFVWRLPVYSLLSAYFFSVLPTRASNIYIMSSLFLWVVSMIIGIWIG